MKETQAGFGFAAYASTKKSSTDGVVVAEHDLSILKQQLEEALSLQRAGEGSLQQDTNVDLIGTLLQRLEDVQDVAALLGLSPETVSVPGEKEKEELGFRVVTPEPKITEE